MSGIDKLRDEQLELRVRERELLEQEQEIKVELSANRQRQAQVKSLLVTDSRTSMRLKSVSTHAGARRTLARMGAFTMSEVEAELGWDRTRVKKLLDVMLCEKPPVLKHDGRVMHRPFFRYIGPEPVGDDDPVVDRDLEAIEALREWLVTRDASGINRTFTPAQVANAIDVPRATALRACRSLVDAGMLVDEGPTSDMPIFAMAGVDVTIDEVAPVQAEKPSSQIPQIQELLTAAYEAMCDVSESNGHFSVETLDGRTILIPKKPSGREQTLQVKGRLRRAGVKV